MQSSYNKEKVVKVGRSGETGIYFFLIFLPLKRPK